MNAEYFLDTNIVVYAFDQEQERKRKIALRLTRPASSWAISWQVIQEFCSVGLHRFSIPPDHEFLTDYLGLILLPQCRVMPSVTIYQKALRIQQETQYRFYDSLIVAAALESGAPVLYSEDLQHDRSIGSLRIVNPFL